MNKIVSKQQFSERVFKFEIEAPLIAKSRKAGNFVIVRVDKKSERMPLTIADADVEKGTITLVVQEVGLSSTKLCNLSEGDNVADIVGPLGNPTHIENFGTVICAGGGVGVAPMLPIIKALKAAGNRVLSVLAGRNKDLIIMEDDVRANSDETLIMTDDGSAGEKGVVTVGIEKFIKQEHIDKVFAIGPPIMMKFCCLLTQKYNLPTDVSLNTIMVDGTGMCGACRLTIGGKTKFVCIDGPEFDGALVDWDEMFKRMGTFKAVEREEMEHYQDHINQVDNNLVVEKTDIAMDVEPTNETVEELTDRNSVWRKELRASMKPKERSAIDRAIMQELDPVYRATTRLEEVNIGLTKEQALLEAKRCLDCGKPSCVEGCPVNINIPSFVKNIERGQFLAAAKVLKNTSALPAVCGRVCPQEKQCESKCIHIKMGGKAVAIGYLERFAADYERQSGQVALPQMATPNGIKVAVVGSGPAGLSFAGDMVKKGYDVFVFEALHEIGGVLKYGIPEFRLPNRIVDVEIENLRKMGVHFITDCIVGKTISVEELEEKGFKGIFVASGAGLPRFMNIPGENALNIMSSNEYLTRVNLMDAADPTTDTPINLGKKVIVVGGGNTAMDSCRTAKRLGAEVAIVYRRSEQEMPARLEEVKHAKEEGINFMTLHNPKEYLVDENGAVKAAVLEVMELGEPDESGRRSPVPTGETVTMECDQVIVAIGVSPNPLVPNSIPGLELGRKNTIAVNDEMQSSRSDLFAGGDIVRGGATVILAMGDGRKAAANMDKKLQADV
ncbi:MULTISPECIES: bifunctional dihydroorotate dehydrogenase B NAD binding subunit/NADPH-dependent glutamate synthase [Segatella]|uniref:Glutamate synthase, small subunit n=2 Tax=Segatella TaxID=2974251 RepID=D8DYJ1_9BACT|nr:MULTISPECIES: bifunctional dihydroorotate dehydrogenase B NAD binding subunit/NADPH-dependent glutamate synthase [Segatella]EFI71515.1 glutamate synthase, small subunit [Segatella baroniae B14]UKK78768.1 bifunctional dihydroorotate dehydrogenase B NAD binding subunit/NADPH-dependent glutamate synthase [Segatella baroniae B14]GJG26904.1 2-polyprenylphenol hydroxylase [Segatella bryantii]SER07110.1 glutamate synthase (NADPH/NADH) small chain [Segatella baroniae B14]